MRLTGIATVIRGVEIVSRWGGMFKVAMMAHQINYALVVLGLLPFF